MSVLILRADARQMPLADESVQCVVTSPPYWGLRKYAGAQEVDWDDWRGAFGLEPRVGMYVQHTVEILREVWRVLRSDGVVFWNIGDSYSGSWGNYGGGNRGAGKQRPIVKGSGAQNPAWEGLEGYRPPASYPQPGLKPKDLCLIPARVALAAQADGWWVRSLIIWAKPNPMPESCKDRPTDAYEHIIMLTKSAQYYNDADAVREPQQSDSLARMGRDRSESARERAFPLGPQNHIDRAYRKNDEEISALPGRNLRNVWTFPTQPYRGAHFATFPEEIPRRCILAASKVGDLILDPFAGSGTVGRVAVELNRRAVLIDLAYHDHAERRTRNVQRNLLAVGELAI